jgi:hypothetical protein
MEDLTRSVERRIQARDSMSVSRFLLSAAAGGGGKTANDAGLKGCNRTPLLRASSIPYSASGIA